MRTTVDQRIDLAIRRVRGNVDDLELTINDIEETLAALEARLDDLQDEVDILPGISGGDAFKTFNGVLHVSGI